MSAAERTPPHTRNSFTEPIKLESGDKKDLPMKKKLAGGNGLIADEVVAERMPLM